MGQGIDGVANRVEPGVIWVVGREGLGGFGAAGPVEGGRRGRVGVAELVGRGRVGQLVGTFAQPKRAYVCGVNYALQTAKERKSWRKMGEGGKHCVENTHVMEKNK